MTTAPGKATDDSPEAIRRRYEALLQTVGDGIYGTDAGGRIQFANPAAARLLGYRVDELVGKDAHDLLHHARVDGSAYNRDDCPETATARDGTVHHVRGGEVLWRKDGRPLPVELVTSPMPAGDGRGVLTTFRSTGDLERVEQALRESEERFRRLSDAALEAVAISENGRFIDVNHRFESMFGYAVEELTGRPIVDLVAPESRDAVSRNVRAGTEGTYNVMALRKDGVVFPVEVSAKSIPYKGRSARVTVLRDLSDRRSGTDSSSVSRPLVRRIVQDLTEAGGVAHQILQQVGRKLAAETDAKDAAGFVRAFAEMGLGEVKVEKGEEGRYSFTGTDLLEKRQGARAATCYFTLGYLSEVVSRVSHGEPTLGTEIECQSRGSPHCRFVVQVRKPEEGLARRVKELV